MSNSKPGMNVSGLHLGLYAISLVREINNIRTQMNDSSRKLVYVSDTLSQAELLWEFLFISLNEKVEPLIYFIEGAKVLLRLKEYVGLITKEKIGWYISKERYEEHKIDEEKKKSTVMLPRSNKCLPKPDKFNVSRNLVKYALKSVNSVDSFMSEDDGKFVSGPDRFKNVSIQRLNEPEDRKNFITRSLCYLWKKLKYLKKVINSRKFKISEFLLIIRPFLYMFFLLKNGTDSYKPFLISLVIEVIAIFMGLQKINRCKTVSERQELSGRWKGLLKYFLKEPFYSQYTVKIVHAILSRVINDSKIGMVLSVLAYFKYYCYIV